METLIITTDKKLEDVIFNALSKFEIEMKKKQSPETISKNKFAKLTNKAHLTVSRMVEKGILKATPDGRIFTSELDKFFE